jgi:hypothetical protein
LPIHPPCPAAQQDREAATLGRGAAGAPGGGWIIALTLVALGILHLATLRPGQDWGDDFAQYVAHARNLVEHRPYAQTGYVVNPDCPMYAPRAYPPLLPLMLAPIVYVAGLNVEPMKWLMVGVLVLGLGAIDWVLRRELKWPARLAIILLIGLNPYVYQFKNSILSDLPFLFFVYAAVAWSGRIDGRHGRRWWAQGILLGVLMELAWATRMVGLALPVALVLRDLVVRRTLARSTLVALGVFALLAGVQAAAFPTSGDYGAMLALDVTAPGSLAGMVWAHICGYADMLAQIWHIGGLAWVAWVMLVATGALAVMGYVRVCRHRRGASILEFFVPLYFLVVLVWPVPQDLRFLLPVLAAFFYYAAVGLGAVVGTGRRRWMVYGVGGALALTRLLSAVAGDLAAPHGAFDDGTTGTEAQELFAAIVACTDPGHLIVAAKPRAIALFTRRPATPYSVAGDAEQFLRRLEQLHVRHLVVNAPLPSESERLGPQNAGWWQAWEGPYTRVIFHNDRYALIRLATDRTSGPPGFEGDN